MIAPIHSAGNFRFYIKNFQIPDFSNISGLRVSLHFPGTKSPPILTTLDLTMELLVEVVEELELSPVPIPMMMTTLS